MNNLKRIFSLGLATVMVIGMMVTGASAAFTDAESIEKTDAANTVVALGIMSGDLQPDGTVKFDAKGDVTRAQFATMIAMALNGGKDFRGSSVTGYPDVDGTASAWAGKFIKFCIDKEIISGKVPGKVFDPTGKVTAQEASAMILLAMGYKKAQLAAPAGSADWAVKINERAETIKLYDDTDVVDYSEAINRENAAQMIYNGILAGTPVWEEQYDSEKGTTYKMTGIGGPSILSTVFEAEIEYAILTDTAYNPTTETYTYTFTTAGITVDPLAGTTLTSKTDYSDLFMQKVQVIYSGDSATAGATVIGITAAHQNVIGTGAYATMKVDTTKKTIDGIGLSGTGTAPTSINVYAFNNDADVHTLEAKPATSMATKGYVNYNLIDNDNDNKIDVIVTYPVTVGKVEKVTDKQITLVGGSAETIGTGVIGYEGIAKDDMVLVTAAANTGKGIKTLTKAEVISDVTATAKSDTNVYTMGGAEYTLDGGVSVTLGKSYDIVAVNGCVLAATLHKTGTTTNELDVSKYAYITGFGINAQAVTDANGNPTSKFTQKVTLLFTDGSDPKTVDVVKIGTDPVTDSNKISAKGLCSFTVKDGKYTLTPVNGSTAITGYTTTTDSTNQIEKGKQGEYRFSDDATLFVAYTVNSEATVKVMTGAEINAWETATTSVSSIHFSKTNSSTGFKYVAFGCIDLGANNLPGAAASELNYGYVVAANEVWDATANNGDGASVVKLTVWNGTENVTYTVEESLSTAKARVFVSYKVTGDKITTISDVTPTKLAVSAYDGEEIVLTDGTTPATYKMKKVTVIYVNEKDGVGAAEGTIKLADKDATTGKLVNNVRAVIDTTPNPDVLVTLYVDVNNKLAD